VRQVSTLRLLNVRQKLFMMFNKKHKHRIGLSEIETEVDEDKLNSILYYLTFEPNSKIPKGLSNVKTVNSHVVKNYYNYFAKRGSKVTLQDIEKIMYCVHESIMKEVIEKEKVYVMPSGCGAISYSMVKSRVCNVLKDKKIVKKLSLTVEECNKVIFSTKGHIEDVVESFVGHFFTLCPYFSNITKMNYKIAKDNESFGL